MTFINPCKSGVATWQHPLKEIAPQGTGQASGKGKPYGVIQLVLAGMISATPVTNPALLPQVGVLTKSPSIVSTAGYPSGGQFYLAGYWATLKGLRSPPSPIITFFIP